MWSFGVPNHLVLMARMSVFGVKFANFQTHMFFVVFRHSEPSILMSRMSVWRPFWTFSEIFNFVVLGPSEPSCTDGEDVCVW